MVRFLFCSRCVVCCLMRAVKRLSFACCWYLDDADCVLCAVDCCLLIDVCGWWFADCRSFCVGSCSFFVVRRCGDLVVCCLLSIVLFLLLPVCCRLSLSAVCCWLCLFVAVC